MQNSSPNLEIIDPIMRRYFQPKKEYIVEKQKREPRIKPQPRLDKKLLQPVIDENNNIILPALENITYLQQSQACYFLAISDRVLYKLAKKGRINCKRVKVKKFTYCYYRVDDLKELLLDKLKENRFKLKYISFFKDEMGA